MEPDDLKAAWQSLETRMARSDAVHLALLRETRLLRAKGQLRPLKIGHWLQAALGIALIVLGVACWTRNTDVAGLLVAGIAVHAFGVLTILGATATLVLAGRVDYAAPVLQIQRQLAALLRVYALNAGLCGAPWWIMWVPVVVAFAGLGEVEGDARAHHAAARHQRGMRQRRTAHQPQREQRGAQRDQHRQPGDGQVVAQHKGHLHRQHADEVHRPDANAHCDASASQPDARRFAAAGGDASCHIERGPGRQDGNNKRYNYEKLVVMAHHHSAVDS